MYLFAESCSLNQNFVYLNETQGKEFKGNTKWKRKVVKW